MTPTYWIELSEYDLETAGAMLKSKRYLYVGFMAHQAIEKILKGCFVHLHQESAPRSHNLTRLARKSDIYEHLSEKQKDLIDTLEPLNIETRYPTDKDLLLKSLTEPKCIEILQYTKELHSWIMKKFLLN